MNTLYKNTQGNIYAVSPIQTPKKEWVALTKEETEAHLNPVPTNIPLAGRLTMEDRERVSKDYFDRICKV